MYDSSEYTTYLPRYHAGQGAFNTPTGVLCVGLCLSYAAEQDERSRRRDQTRFVGGHVKGIGLHVADSSPFLAHSATNLPSLLPKGPICRSSPAMLISPTTRSTIVTVLVPSSQRHIRHVLHRFLTRLSGRYSISQLWRWLQCLPMKTV